MPPREISQKTLIEGNDDTFLESLNTILEVSDNEDNRPVPLRERSLLVHHETEHNEKKSPIIQSCQHLLKSNGSIVGNDVAQCILQNYSTVQSAIPSSDSTRGTAGIQSIDGRKSITHDQIKECILEFGTIIHSIMTKNKVLIGRGSRIAVILPNGPELAVTLLCVTQYATCIPLSASSPIHELTSDIQRCDADVVIGLHKQVPIEALANDINIPYIGIVPSPTYAGLFTLQLPSPPTLWSDNTVSTSKNSTRYYKDQLPNSIEDDALILFTSGTTGNKKLVPHKLGEILVSATIIALSWNLSYDDVNCNMMPLFHVGGIIRQVFAPMFAGSSVICCPNFDPITFWSLLASSNQRFTWYYAAPTMHQLILQTGKDENYISSTSGKSLYPLRMIANAAGGLLPSLATEMQHVFHGVHVLPSYGMTECMPISSPPYNYNLEKPGTSGVPVGPEVSILNLATGVALPPDVEGPICVRGYPCFRGYGTIRGDPELSTSTKTTPSNDTTFIFDGWFNTGDLGYLDSDGYLYITGRSKEVINRGGEIISPMEVEEAITIHPDVNSCIAFSAAHTILQEVVGVAIVMQPNRPRLDIQTLHEFLSVHLAAPKWPHCIVYMDALPKSHTNKLLRVKLGQRLQIPELTDAMTTLERTYEATCPPQGTTIDVPINAKNVEVDCKTVEKRLKDWLHIKPNEESIDITVVAHPQRAGSLICYTINLDREKVVQICLSKLDRYMVPSFFVEATIDLQSKRTLPLPKMTDATVSILQELHGRAAGPVNELTKQIQEIFIQMLNLDYTPNPTSNFFHLGGSSMLASQLASRIRKGFSIACSGSEIFQCSTPCDIAKLIEQRSKTIKSDDDTNSTTSESSGSGDGVGSGGRMLKDHGAPFETKPLPCDSSRFSWYVQLTPMILVFPIWQVTRSVLFFAMLLWSIQHLPGPRNIIRFAIAFIAFHTVWVTITPLIFILIKWMVIGKYKKGRYPIWGSYYLRWWFVDICRKLFLRGIYGSNDMTLNWYYRMLGAKIGKGARISIECDVAEYDLVEVGDNAAIEYSNLRGFGVDNGAMILGPVKVGNNASVGNKSVVAPYTSIPDNCHLGPVSSSYECGPALDACHARVNRKCLPEPNVYMQLFVIGPITLICNAIGQIPPFMVLFWMLQFKGISDEGFFTLNDLMQWLSDPYRIPYFIGIRVARATLTPFFYMAASLFMKKFVIGRFEPGPRNVHDQWQLTRHALAATLFSRSNLQEVTDLIGRHYELVSTLYRLLGAKVGKRIFWPGQLPVCTGEYDLLEVGDDVVFGSRSSIFFTTIDSCEKVILCAGSNVADNCVVLPGSIIGKNAVLGSNSICPEGWCLPEQSVWLGSSGGVPLCLEKGNDSDVEHTGPLMSNDINHKTITVSMTGDSTTLRPFGKAFYMKQASYTVLPLWVIVLISFAVASFIAIFHTLPLLGAFHATVVVLYGKDPTSRTFEEFYKPVVVYSVILVMFILANMIRLALWIIIELSAKWTLMGRRKEGRYNYDTSSYAQRWEIYQLICKIRKFSRLNFLEFFSGTPQMTSYFRWNGGTVGKDVCLYPAGADPFMPEPDLVTLGDRCVVDCAALVCHLNTRGNFELRSINIDADCTLRSRSRTQQGVHMEQGSQILEKSLALTGEVVEQNTVWQGCPASYWFTLEKEV